MTQRYFVDELPAAGGHVSLSDQESQHASRVMRLQVGDEITLFDGQGCEAKATVFQIDRRHCQCDASPAMLVSREASVQLHLAIAFPKPDRAKEMIERLTELGVASVTPILTQRCQRPISPSVLEKSRRVVVEASKQCGRNQLLDIRQPIALSRYLETAVPDSGDRWMLHTNIGAAVIEGSPASQVTGLVGPEGGFTAQEVVLAQEHGFVAYSLGSRILRIETAAVALAAIYCTKDNPPNSR